MNLNRLRLPSAPTMSRLDTPDVDSWASILAALSIGGSVECSSPGDIPGEISACRLIGGGLLAVGSCEPQMLIYDTTGGVSDRKGSVTALIALEGCGSMEQGRRAFRYAAGDMIFRRAGGSARLNVEQKSRFFGLQIPMTRFFGAFLNYGKEFTPVRVSADASSARAAKQYAETWMSADGSASPRSLFFAEQALICLSAAAYYEATCQRGSSERHTGVSGHPHGRMPVDAWERVLTILDAEICNPDLSADTLANLVGISKRYMHKLFEKKGLRYGQHVLHRRLEHARAELDNVTLTTLRVGEIAYRAGFNDAGHFSRAFRQLFAVAPSAYRESHLHR